MEVLHLNIKVTQIDSNPPVCFMQFQYDEHEYCSKCAFMQKCKSESVNETEVNDAVDSLIGMDG
jgi:hypothetical protein